MKYVKQIELPTVTSCSFDGEKVFSTHLQLKVFIPQSLYVRVFTGISRLQAFCGRNGGLEIKFEKKKLKKKQTNKQTPLETEP